MTVPAVPTNALPTTAVGRGYATLPLVAAVLVLLNGLYLLLVAFGNLTDYDTNQAFVQHVLAMDTTNFGQDPGVGLDPDVMWRAITDPALQTLAYAAIIAGESIGALLLIAGFVLFILERGTGYHRARLVSTLGLLVLVAIFFGGFIVGGGEWFQMWKSSSWNGLDPAFRNSVLAMITLVVLHLPSEVWQRGRTRAAAAPATAEPATAEG